MDFSEETSKIMAEAGKELPFTLPRHYFDDFPARLQARIEQQSAAEEPRKLRLYDYVRPALGLAAAFATVFMLVYWPAKLVTSPGQLSQNQGTTDAERIINLVEHVDDHTFFSLLENENTTEPLSEEALESYIAANYSDYDIYLETQK